MTNEQRKTRAQYLNGLAVAVLTVSVPATVSGAVVPWLLVPVLLVSIALHLLAGSTVR